MQTAHLVVSLILTIVHLSILCLAVSDAQQTLCLSCLLRSLVSADLAKCCIQVELVLITHACWMGHIYFLDADFTVKKQYMRLLYSAYGLACE